MEEVSSFSPDAADGRVLRNTFPFLHLLPLHVPSQRELLVKLHLWLELRRLILHLIATGLGRVVLLVRSVDQQLVRYPARLRKELEVD